MADGDVNLMTSLNYYLREKYYHHAEEIAEEGLRKFVNDPVLQLYSAVALFMQDRPQEAIRLLEPIADHPLVSLGAVLALIFAHKACKTVDKEALQLLENQLREQRRTASDKPNYFAALYFFHTGKPEKAAEFIEKAVKQTSSNAEYACLRGWIRLTSKGGQPTDTESAVGCFEDALRYNTVFPDAFLGKAKYMETRNNSGGVLEVLNQASVQMPGFLPVHIEKMKAQLMLREWEQCIEVAQRCQIMDPHCVDSLKYFALYNLCYEGNAQDASTHLVDLLQELDRTESTNWRLYMDTAKLFSRLCGRNLLILPHTRNFADRAVTASKGSSEAQTEMAHQLRLSASTKQAIKMFKQALEVQTDAMNCLIGLIHCQIIDNELAEAKSQLDFLKEVHADAAKTIKVKFLEAIMMRRNNAPKTDVLKQFATAVEEHFLALQSLPFGPRYFEQLDADFLIEVVSELLTYAPVEPLAAGQTCDPPMQLAIRILSSLVEALPAHVEALYLLGKVKYLAADTDGAGRILQQCLIKDQTYSDAHLLMAQIYLQQDNFKQASQSLEVGLSFNFEVREHPLYHLIKARIQKRSKDTAGAIQTLETAMGLPGFKRPSVQATTSKKSSRLELTPSDRASVYLELIDALQMQGRTDEAQKLMQEAQSELQGTREEQRLMLINADIALARGDADRALTMLGSVGQDQPHYLQARQKMGEIYLHHKRDKRLFATCYKELVEKSPTIQTYIMLGDAYMSIQEPERAIEVYENAMKKNPKDHALARKIGQAYIRSHNYSKAVNYYEAALKSGQQNFLRYDLAELLFRLKNFEKCERFLRQGLERQSGQTGGLDVQNLQDEVKFLALLSKVYFRNGNNETGVAMLTQAKDQQAKVIKRGPAELAESFDDQKKFASSICSQLAEYYEQRREFDKAIGLYKEALAFYDNDKKAMQALAHLHLLNGNLDACNQQCMLLLKIDKNNDKATLMLADMMYQKNQSESAMFHYKQLLERNPNQYGALARVIELLWRAGAVLEMEKCIQQAEAANARAVLEPGFNYCRGMFEWHTGDPNAALQYFNKARKDPEWGEQAVYNMIEICLNPDNEIIGGEVFEQGEAVDTSAGSERQDAQETGVRTAERFLKDLQNKPGLNYRYELTKNFILVATKNRSNVEQALQAFSEAAGSETNEGSLNVGAILGVARSYMVLKQTPKAKQQLKRVLGRQWNFEDADYLEQCWLLLADTYINQTKYDVASEILKTCVQHNASCLKAYEYMGFIREKEQKWSEAAASYEHAWKLIRRRNPTIGYKLSFNYLKSKRYIDAIDVCHKVLELYPNYPKIRKDILDKARSNLRM